MNDLISRQAAIDAVNIADDNGQILTILDVLDILKELPSAQPESEQMYKKAFSVACELLIGANLFGTTEETMFAEIMEKDGIVSSLGYERYILDNLARLTGDE